MLIVISLRIRICGIRMLRITYALKLHSNRLQQDMLLASSTKLFIPNPGKHPTSHIPYLEHPTPPNIPHPKRSTSWTVHIPNIPHPEHFTSRTSHIPNIPHPGHPTSRTSHIPIIQYPEHPKFPTSSHPQHLTCSICHFPSIPHSQHLTSRRQII